METDEQMPSTSSTSMETEDIVPSTSAVPFVVPHTTSTARTNAQRQREYRLRQALTRTPEQVRAFAKAAAERQRRFKLRKSANIALTSGTSESPASTSCSVVERTSVPVVAERTSVPLTNAQRQRAFRQRRAASSRTDVQPNTSSTQTAIQLEQSTWYTKWSSSIRRFQSTFLDNDFGHACSVCDRLWFKNDLKTITALQLKVISDWYVKENRQLRKEDYTKSCNTCRQSLNKRKLPTLAKVNGFSYPDIPPGLPPLDPISERLVSPRLPFMQVRRLRHDFSYGIIGQVINVPVNVQDMVKCLPRHLEEDDVINVNIKRNLAHKTNYISGYMSKRTVKEWLDVLQNSSLYRLYDIKIDLSRLQPALPSDEGLQDDPANRIEAISAEYTPESEVLAARQHTLLWNEEDCLDIAPGHRATPLNIIYDRHAEELSFPAIYFGEPRRFNMNISVTPYMMATSEIRRSDRRGATPQKVLYDAMKILRLRMVDGIYSTFRSVSITESVTRRMLEDPEFLKEFVVQNLAFMKSVPNSVQYWASRKRDLFAMLRQLGKPTIFLTLSANEVRWLVLLNLLLKLSNKYPGKVAEDLNTSERCNLVSDDPITCCIYFHKLVGTLMKMLKSKQSYNPFGQYYVEDYFLRIEFQHRGSPHAHILLWLHDDPHETVSENMPKTIELVEKLSSVAKEDVPNDTIYANQIHKHTFTCTKRGETTCRFGIPYWPMLTTRVLIPMPQTDGRRIAFQKKAKELRNCLSERTYASMDDFLREHSLTFDAYLDVVRSTLRRPSMLFKRNFDQLMTNTFNPYLAGEIKSNIDIQFILDEYSCAQYVVEYVNKSARGMGNLNRELTKMMEEHPDRDYTGQLKALSVKLLNAVEMSAQEAAWYLLRQPMSETSRQIMYIPTVWPSERQRCRKRRKQMDRENIEADSTDVFTKNIIQRYEERPPSLESSYLAEFASYYADYHDFIDNEDDVDVQEDEIEEPVTEERTTVGRTTSNEHRRRKIGRIIRYRRYEIDETVNYQREMVLLFLPFRNEIADIVDSNKFLQLFNDNKDTIMERRQLFENNLNIDSVMQELEAMMILQNSDSREPPEIEERGVFVEQVLGGEGSENNDDVNQIVPREGLLSVVKKRSNVMPKQQFCELIRTTNPEQRELIHEVIHRLHGCGDEVVVTLQVFFTGPAGCGKTYSVKCLMETYNRYTQEHNSLNNAYVACASTGKAAVPIGGTTVHSAFRLTNSRVTKLLSAENLQAYRNMFVGVKVVFIDEISMLSAAILGKINYRLQQITGIYDQPFGGIHMILCGDFRQLPPVRASPCYTVPHNQLGGPVLWQSINYFPLVRVVRQTDELFSTILTKIGDGLKLSVNNIALIESRHKSEVWCKENVPDAVRLYYSNHEVDSYNRNAIQNAHNCIATDIMLGYSSNSEKSREQGKLHKMSVAETDGLPYMLPLAVGYPYMITSNIDVADGLVNGAIGVLLYIERQPANADDRSAPGGPSTSTSLPPAKDEIATLWFQFEDKNTGTKAKIKCRPHVHSKPNTLSVDWVPVHKKVVNISLTKTVKCKRKQFPCVPACAITIHKAQGGTFTTIVYKYSSKQPQQLVYVAMSRVTSIDGLYIITEKDSPLVFKHGRDGNDSQTTRDIRNEYLRLRGHTLDTITKQAVKFCDDATDAGQLIVTNINCQSLSAHAADIETDTVIPRSDYLVLTETWMRDTCEPTPIKGYECVSRENTRTNSDTNAAGGVAIYRKLSSISTAEVVQVAITDVTRVIKTKGDMCMTEVTCFAANTSFKFILGAVYIHPGASMQDIGMLLWQGLGPYIHNSQYVPPFVQVDSSIPILLCGDFNKNVKPDNSFLNFMKNTYNLDCVSNVSKSTTLKGTTIDLTFARHITAETLPFISYFSYHRPILNKITQIGIS